MTISTTASTTTIAGNGATTTFDFSFIAGLSNNIVVTYTDANGLSTVLSPSVYSVVLNGPAAGQIWGIGGSVTYPLSGSPIAAGTSLEISRIVPLTQTTSISNQGAFYPEVVEAALDMLCMQIQQVTARTGQYRGTWATGILYNYGDIVVDGANGANTGNYYICAAANTSGTWSTDLAAGYWVLAFSVQTLLDLAIIAAASVLVATSSTNNVTIGTGSQTLSTQAQKEFQNGMYLIASDVNNSNNYMVGQVTSYSGTTLVLNVTAVNGAGTPSGWNIAVSGPPGPAGSQGPSGSIPIAAAGGTANAITATITGVTLTDQTLCAVVLAAAATVTNPTFSPNSLTAHTITARGGQALVVGDLPAANFVAMLEYNAANTRWELLNPASAVLSSTLAVSGGGTGRTTLAANGVLIGEGTGGINATSAGTSGQLLTSNGSGTDPSFKSLASSQVTTALGGTPWLTSSLTQVGQLTNNVGYITNVSASTVGNGTTSGVYVATVSLSASANAVTLTYQNNSSPNGC